MHGSESEIERAIAAAVDDGLTADDVAPCRAALDELRAENRRILTALHDATARSTQCALEAALELARTGRLDSDCADVNAAQAELALASARDGAVQALTSAAAGDAERHRMLEDAIVQVGAHPRLSELLQRCRSELAASVERQALAASDLEDALQRAVVQCGAVLPTDDVPPFLSFSFS